MSIVKEMYDNGYEDGKKEGKIEILNELMNVLLEWKSSSSVVSCDTLIQLLQTKKINIVCTITPSGKDCVDCLCRICTRNICNDYQNENLEEKTCACSCTVFNRIIETEEECELFIPYED